MCRRCSGMFDCNVHGCKEHTSVLPGVPRYSTGGWQVVQGPIGTEPSHSGRATDRTDGKPKRSPSASV